MNNGYEVALFTIYLHIHGPILTSDTAWIFPSPGNVPYGIFALSEDIFGAIFCETAFLFSPLVKGRWWWWETTSNISSTLVICIQIVYIYYIWLKSLFNINLVHAKLFVIANLSSPSLHPLLMVLTVNSPVS